MPKNFKLDQQLIEQVVRLGKFKTKWEAINSALAEFVARRERFRILELEGQIDFHPDWDYKQMRRGR